LATKQGLNKYKQNTCSVLKKTILDNLKGKTGRSNQNLGFMDLELQLPKQFFGRSIMDPKFIDELLYDESQMQIHFYELSQTCP